MKKTVLKPVQTYLPLFTGFYGTNFQMEYDTEDVCDILGIPNIPEPKNGFYDYEKANNQYAKIITNKVSDMLIELDYITKPIIFEKLVSPRYYNYSNDTINVSIFPKVSKLKETVKENIDDFESYIKEHFTSRSGFFSSYPNDVDYWLNVINHKSLRENTVYLGIILDFVLSVEGIDYHNLYEQVNEHEREIILENGYSFESLTKHLFLNFDYIENAKDFEITEYNAESVLNEIKEFIKHNYINITKEMVMEAFENDFMYFEIESIINHITKEIESNTLEIIF